MEEAIELIEKMREEFESQFVDLRIMSDYDRGYRDAVNFAHTILSNAQSRKE